jgi:hypothetical protein
MSNDNSYLLSKTDFLLYLECPMHLWAKVHGQSDLTPSPMTQSLFRQGYEVEQLALEYLREFVIRPSAGKRISSQETFSDVPFAARVDALVHVPATDCYDLYEIKSSTSVDKEHYWDCAFQYLVLKQYLRIEHVFLLHLNREYILGDHLDMEQLFVAEDVTGKVQEYAESAKDERQKALQVALHEESHGIEHCYSPKNCPCPQLCHPSLPDFSIYDIAGLQKPKKQALERMGIFEAAKVPPTFKLNENQRQIVHMAQHGMPLVDQDGIRNALAQLSFPLYFLDYETFNAAIPMYVGYHPQQQMVFQYSLHRLDALGGILTHTEHVCTDRKEPSLGLLDKLSHEVGSCGTVLVWNKLFEMTRNSEMAEIHPEYQPSLEDMNSRIYDLADFVKKGLYLHPGFRGSWSIKNVLPVMVPGLSYENMEIGEGGQASEAWWQMVYGDAPLEEKERTRQALLKYCELDTLAMVKIYERLVEES